jgi:hypothetical protein
MAVCQPAAGSVEILRRVPSRLELAKMADPDRKVLILHPPLEAGELQMSMRVDQTGNEYGVAELECRHAI